VIDQGGGAIGDVTIYGALLFLNIGYFIEMFYALHNPKPLFRLQHTKYSLPVFNQLVPSVVLTSDESPGTKSCWCDRITGTIKICPGLA